jgi:hypothetical protein
VQTVTPATGKEHAATAEEAVAIVKKARPRLRLGENQLAFLRQRLEQALGQRIDDRGHTV